MNKLNFLPIISILFVSVSCGGGGGGSQSETLPNPQIFIYQTFDLNNSILTGGVSDGFILGCTSSNTKPSQLALSKVLVTRNPDLSYTYTNIEFLLDGNFTLPAGGCSTVGITGVITGAVYKIENNTVYRLSSLSIDASSFRLGRQVFWGNVTKQTGKIINSQVTNQAINIHW